MKKFLSKLALATAALVLPTAALAAEEAKDPARNISGSVGLDIYTDYISRGVLYENQGFIAQPYGELAFKLYEAKEGVQGVSLFAGVWNSLHSEQTGAIDGSTSDAWFEIDWYAGLSFAFMDKWTFKAQYGEFISPSDAFGTCKNLQFVLAFNDADLIAKGFALNPYVQLFIELDGKAGTGSDEGVYVELGIAPAFALTQGDYGLTLTIPVAIGLGFDDFYTKIEDGDTEDDTFGFVKVGATLSMPLAFMADAGFGTWTFAVGGEVYFFGDAAEQAASANGNEDMEWVGFVRTTFSF